MLNSMWKLYNPATNMESSPQKSLVKKGKENTTEKNAEGKILDICK